MSDPAPYDLDEDPADVAADRDQIVVLPEPTDLLIDIDTARDRNRCYQSLAVLANNGVPATVLWDKASASGGEHRHIYVRFERELSAIERIALQAACGSDRTREILSVLRLWTTERAPTVLFEAADFTYPSAPPHDGTES